MGELDPEAWEQEKWSCSLLQASLGELKNASGTGELIQVAKTRKAGRLTNPDITQAQNQGYELADSQI